MSDPELPAESSEPPAPSGPRLIVGLGNPGAKYSGTRHNVGFDALDLFAKRLQAEAEPFLVGGQRIGDVVQGADQQFILLWPMTYMNRSGRPMVAAMREFEIDAAQILIITDDFHLDLGGLRVRANGSTGGHNGLASIEDVLGSSDYARLRIGVGSPGADTVDFVLDRFSPDEEPIMEETVMIASWAAEDWAQGLSIDELQAKYNRRKPQA